IMEIRELEEALLSDPFDEGIRIGLADLCEENGLMENAEWLRMNCFYYHCGTHGDFDELKIRNRGRKGNGYYSYGLHRPWGDGRFFDYLLNTRILFANRGSAVGDG